ncbi:MAG: cytochrome b, partial [Candidatus Latescibacteria bacterium]|nr:cytochrome b [Candidatus Latescibacterota bacterium]
AGKTCGDCHSDITEIPHPVHTRRVECTQCHFEQNTVGAPRSASYKQYQESVHGRAAAAGNAKAPGCQDCHGSHQIGSHQDSTSQVSRANVSRTCGRCHLEVFAAFQTSIHGVELEKGNADVPTCTGCHSEHNIRAHDDPASQTNAENIAATCSVCHAAEGLMGKYGIDQAQVDTYTKSFHGIAIRFGMRTVANCASCHGVHDIRPPEDPTSSVHLDNIPKTCGKCHPGANINYTQGKIHVKPQDPESGIVYYVSSFFKWLTISVICALIAHILLDLFRQFRRRQAEK